MSRRFLGALAGLALALGLAAPAHAGAVYPLWKEAILQASTNSALTGTVKCQLLTATYTYSASHQFLSDLTGLVSSPQTLASKTYTAGKFVAATITFPSVTVGSTVNAVGCWIDSGVAGTSRLIVYLNGISVVTNGGDIVISWDGTFGLFQL